MATLLEKHPPGPDFEMRKKVEEFIQDLNQGDIKGSFQVAYQTVQVLQAIIEEANYDTARELMNIVKKEGRLMMAAEPIEAAVGNMVRRVLKIIREEYKSLLCFEYVDGRYEAGKGVLNSFGGIVSWAAGLTEEDDRNYSEAMMLSGQEEYSEHYPNFKESVMDMVKELVTEVESSSENIAGMCLEHIHSDDVILTAGRSRTVEAFLKKAAEKRKFEVYVMECAPFYHGQQLAMSLGKADIDTTVITDAAVFAIMSRVNKVIIGTHTVMANGGLRAISGSYSLGAAAEYHKVPVLVCAPMYKLSPQYYCSTDQEGFNKFLSPDEVLPDIEDEELGDVICPVFDYVPPELVTLFISNIGGNAPSYIYRLLSELYDKDDYEL